jgi:hypothetical protein
VGLKYMQGTDADTDTDPPHVRRADPKRKKFPRRGARFPRGGTHSTASPSRAPAVLDRPPDGRRGRS